MWRRFVVHLIDREYQQDIENKIRDDIQNNFSFCILQEESKEARVYLESRIIPLFLD